MIIKCRVGCFGNMKKLILIIDKWNANKTFIEEELKCIKEKYEVTIVCDFDNEAKYPKDTKYIPYRRYKGISAIIKLIKCLFDRITWKELSHLRNKKKKLCKISEIIRFYINAELFWDFFEKEVLPVNEEVIVYSYWYFWKVFAITKNRDKHPNIRIISRAHGYDLFEEQSPSGYQPYKRAMDDKLDRLVFVAQFGKEYYLDKYSFTDSDKYCLCHLGTKDYGILNPYKKEKNMRIVSCSRIVPLKRVDMITDALSMIDDIEIEWIHFGGGEMYDAVAKFAKDKLALKSNVRYTFMGNVSKDIIMNYYIENSIDAFVMVSQSEGNPVSVMEAMSFGIPIITTNICNMPNMINGNGIVMDEESASGLAKAIRKLNESDLMEMEKMRNESRRLWEENYNEKYNNMIFLNDVLLRV